MNKKLIQNQEEDVRKMIMRVTESNIHQALVEFIVKDEIKSVIMQGAYIPFCKEIDKIMRTCRHKDIQMRVRMSINKWSDPKGNRQLDKKILLKLQKEVEELNNPDKK